MQPFAAYHMTYQFPRVYRILIYISVAVYFFLASGSIYVGIVDRDVNPHAPVVIGLGLIFILCGIYSAVTAFWMGESITVTDTHIKQNLANGSQLILRWDEIVAVKNRRFLGRIELMAENPKRKIRLDYQLHNFAGLLMMVEHRVADNTNPATRTTESN